MLAQLVRLKHILLLVFESQFCAGCSGTKMLKEPLPMELTRVLASTGNQNLTVNLEWVFVRDGPGSWARNVDWDEYLIRIKNVSSDRIDITGVAVVDSQETSLVTSADRAELVRACKATVKRYKSANI